MRILVDTNVILSAFVFGSGRFETLLEFIATSHELVIAQQIADEARSVTSRKLPDRSIHLERFLSRSDVQLIQASHQSEHGSALMRDESDEPILRTALEHGVDIIVSGDKDFLALEIDRLQILSPASFIAEFMSENE